MILMGCVYNTPAVGVGSDAVPMLSGGLMVIGIFCVRVLPALVATATVKVAVPGAVGVPVMVMVPLTELVLMLASVRPVPPALKLFTEKSVNAVVLPTIERIWL